MNRRNMFSALAGIVAAFSVRGNAQIAPVAGLTPANGGPHAHQWEQTWLLLMGWIKNPGVQHPGQPMTDLAHTTGITPLSADKSYQPKPGVVKRCSICGVLSI